MDRVNFSRIETRHLQRCENALHFCYFDTFSPTWRTRETCDERERQISFLYFIVRTLCHVYITFHRQRLVAPQTDTHVYGRAIERFHFSLAVFIAEAISHSYGHRWLFILRLNDFEYRRRRRRCGWLPLCIERKANKQQDLNSYNGERETDRHLTILCSLVLSFVFTDWFSLLIITTQVHPLLLLLVLRLGPSDLWSRT